MCEFRISRPVQAPPPIATTSTPPPSAPPAETPSTSPAPSTNINTNSTVNFNLADLKPTPITPNSFNFNLTRDFNTTDLNSNRTINLPNSERFEAERNQTVGDQMRDWGKEKFSELPRAAQAGIAAAGVLATGRIEAKFHF